MVGLLWHATCRRQKPVRPCSVELRRSSCESSTCGPTNCSRVSHVRFSWAPTSSASLGQPSQPHGGHGWTRPVQCLALLSNVCGLSAGTPRTFLPLLHRRSTPVESHTRQRPHRLIALKSGLLVQSPPEPSPAGRPSRAKPGALNPCS